MESNEGQITEHASESTGQHLPENPATAEKHLPQSTNNRIVVEAKRDAYEQGIKAGKASTWYNSGTREGCHTPCPTVEKSSINVKRQT